MADALTVSGLDCFYGEVQVLHGMSLTLRKGEVLCVLGRNGAGKTTLLKAIMGLVPASAGSIRLGERELVGLPPHEVPQAGIAYVPQGRRLFAEMSVAENIEIGLMARGKGRGCARCRARPLPDPARTAQPTLGHAVGRRAADAGDGAGTLPGARRAAARRADRRADAVDDRQDPRHGGGAARARRLDDPGRAAGRCRAAGRRPRRCSSRTAAAAKRSTSQRSGPTRRWCIAMSGSG